MRNQSVDDGSPMQFEHDGADNLQQRSELTAELTLRAWRDPDFRSLLLRDPKAAIKDAVGLSMPESINVKVLEEGTTDVYLVLPMNPVDLESLELSEAEFAAASKVGFCHITETQSYGTC